MIEFLSYLCLYGFYDGQTQSNHYLQCIVLVPNPEESCVVEMLIRIPND